MASSKWASSIKIAILCIPFVLGNAVSKDIFFPEVRITPLDILVIGIWIGFFIKLIIKKDILIKVDKFHSTFIAIAIASLTIAVTRYQIEYVLIGAMYLGRWITYSTVYIPLNSLIKPKEGKQMLKFIFLALTTIGLVQYLILPDTRFLSSQNWDDHYYRVIGAHLDPGYTGLMFVMGLTYFWFYERKKVTLVINYIALALTYSRTSYVAFITATTTISLINRNLKLFIFSICLLIFTIIILPRPAGEGVKLERTYSVFARLENWKQAVSIGLKSPVIGIGFNTYRYAQKDADYLSGNWRESHAGAGSDSSTLFVFATTGLLGLTVYFLWYRSLFLNGSQFFKVILIVLFIHSWFLNSLFYVPILYLISILRVSDSMKLAKT